MTELKLTHEQALGLVRFVELLNRGIREIKKFNSDLIRNNRANKNFVWIETEIKKEAQDDSISEKHETKPYKVEPLRWDPDKPDKYRPGSGKRIFPKPEPAASSVVSDGKMTEDTKASVFKTALYYMQMAEIAAQNKCEYLSKHFLKKYGAFEEKILFNELEEEFVAYVAFQNGGKKHGISL